MQRLGVSGAVRPIYGSLGVKRLILGCNYEGLVDFITDSKKWSSISLGTHTHQEYLSVKMHLSRMLVHVSRLSASRIQQRFVVCCI